MKNNDILKKYIIDKYGNIPKFLKKENFSPQDLETVLHKKDVFHEVGIGIKICGFLNIDAEKLFCRNEIDVLENNKDKASEDLNMSLDDIIKKNMQNSAGKNAKKRWTSRITYWKTETAIYRGRGFFESVRDTPLTFMSI